MNGVLDEVVQRIVRVAAPERIILFGSAARGDARGDSDLDLLVVTRDGQHRGQLTRQIYRSLIGVGVAVDVVVVTMNDIERYAESPALVIASALRDGRLLYVA
jgi:predicted nucleotidyltransferase